MRATIRTTRTLRQQIAQIEGSRSTDAASLFALGYYAIDATLGGGLARGRVHEIYASNDCDASSAAGFAAMLAIRAQSRGEGILWLRSETRENRRSHFYAPGFAELGGDPGSLIFGNAPDEASLLQSLGDAARCGGLGVLVAETAGKLHSFDLTASRKLTLSAEKSGLPVFLLRVSKEPAPSAAETRWAVRAAPSTPLTANAPGHTKIEIELLRRRAGPAGMKWRVEWDRDQRIFREPSLSGDLVTFPADGSVVDHRLNAAWLQSAACARREN